MLPVTKKWLFLKFSSLILLPLMLWFILSLVNFYDKSYQEIVGFLTSQPSKFLMGLFLVFISVSALLSPKKPTPEKVKTYECGVDPVGGGWSQTYVRYYIFGLLFVIFDVEAVFIFPWALNLENLGYFGLVEMFIFIFILLLGLIYAIRKDVLKWE